MKELRSDVQRIVGGVDGHGALTVGFLIMGFEVELKFRAVDRTALMTQLAALGARAEPIAAQEDIYLAHPSRDFAQTNEALRLRRVGRNHRITYKGPKHPGHTKTREEIEVALSAAEGDAEALLRLLDRLGFSPVATIRKVRASFHLEFLGRPLEVALDVAEGVGEFVEVETLAADASDLPAAQHAVLECARALGVSEVEPRSYLRMALERSAAGSA